MAYKVASFFSGIGGIDLAFSWCGFDIVLQCEIDEFCQQVLLKHKVEYWPHAQLYGDIHNVTKTEVGTIDVLFGGFPCQDISVAGKQNGVAIGTRSGLWFELLRIISEVRPRVVLLENVSNITNVGGTIVTASLAEVGYDAIWLPLRASDIGAPHQRERWFCVAYCCAQRMGNANGKRQQNTPKRYNSLSECRSTDTQNRRSGIPQPGLGRAINGFSSRLDRHSGQWPARPDEPQYDYEPPRLTGRRDNRANRIKALGNAVVPQQVLPVVQSIKCFLDEVMR